MGARDARDPWWVPAPLDGPPPPKPIRVAVVTAARDLAGTTLHPDVAAAIGRATRWLADAGYEIVDERTPGFTRAYELWFEMQLPEFREYLLPLIEKEGDQGIRTAVRLMLENLPSRDALPYMKALAERARLVREWTAYLDRVPLVLAPVSTEPAYALGFDLESAARTAQVWRECATLMAIPVLGLPAAVVPVGVADGLPIGVQLIGARFREDLCLDAAAAIEARAGVQTPIDPTW
jgi:amidase